MQGKLKGRVVPQSYSSKFNSAIGRAMSVIEGALWMKRGLGCCFAAGSAWMAGQALLPPGMPHRLTFRSLRWDVHCV